MTKARKKYDKYRSLKVITYVLGWPLLILLVAIGSLSFHASAAFGSTWYYGIVVAAGLWVLSIILQLVLGLFFRKEMGKLFVSLAITLILTIGVGFVFDVYMGGLDLIGMEGKITEINKEQEKNGLALKNYNYQIQHYVTLSSKKKSITQEYSELVDSFCRIYNVRPEGKLYGKTNADLSEPIKGEDGAYYSKNGMYADGYVFSMKEAVDILITIKETQAKYKAEEKDADVELKKAIKEAKESSEWIAYQSTKEYQDAYGKDGSATKLMLSEDKLNRILSVLGKNIASDILSIKLGSNSLGDMLDSFLPGVGSVLNEDITLEILLNLLSVTFDLKPHICPTCGTDYGWDSNEVKTGKCSDDNTSLKTEEELFKTLGRVCSEHGEYSTEEAINAHGVCTESGCGRELSIKEKEPNSIAGVLKGFGITDVSVEGVMELVESFFYYQSPETKPIYEFIKDEEMKKYGYACYYAEKHGTAVGSCLKGEMLGMTGLSSSGYLSQNFDFSLDKLYLLRAYNSYVPTYYPLFAVRRYAYFLGAFMMIMAVANFHFKRKQNMAWEDIVAGGEQ